MMANTLSIITYFSKLKTCGMAMAFNILVKGVALALGPVIGGWVNEHIGRPFCFLLNIPLGVVGVVTVFLYLPHTPRNPHVNLDWFAGILFFLMSGCALIGFTFLSAENYVSVTLCAVP